MKKIATFREAYQAHILKGALESAGIPTAVQDEHLATINWVYSHAIGGVKVYVPDRYYDKALDLVEQINITGEDEAKSFEVEAGPGDTCPRCGSTSLEPTNFSRWSLIPALLFLLPVFFGRKRWRCQECGFILK